MLQFNNCLLGDGPFLGRLRLLLVEFNPCLLECCTHSDSYRSILFRFCFLSHFLPELLQDIIVFGIDFMSAQRFYQKNGFSSTWLPCPL